MEKITENPTAKRGYVGNERIAFIKFINAEYEDAKSRIMAMNIMVENEINKVKSQGIDESANNYLSCLELTKNIIKQ